MISLEIFFTFVLFKKPSQGLLFSCLITVYLFWEEENNYVNISEALLDQETACIVQLSGNGRKENQLIYKLLRSRHSTVLILPIGSAFTEKELMYA